jgi:putative FmdB family regulatory protein
VLRSKEELVPTYQYACTECGEPLEVVQKFSDDALTECPACGGRLRKIFSPAAIVFRGSGFYRTDSRNGSGGKGTTSTEPAKKDDAKTETKKESSESASSSKSSSNDSSKGSSNGSSKGSSPEKVA